MKTTTFRRLLCLLLTIAMVLTLISFSYASEIKGSSANLDPSDSDVHNSIDVAEADAEILPDDTSDSPETFSTSTRYDYATELAKFPASYRTLLSKLHGTYSNWIFVADRTGLNFQKAVASEANSVNNVISTSVCSTLMSSASNSSYASSNAVAYYMDPRNYLNKKDIFLFVDIGKGSACTTAGVEAVLSGTNLHQNSTYYKRSGGSKVSASSGTTYAKTILNAGSTDSMNPYFLAAKIITETGGSLSKTATSGQSSSYPNIYNFYNIGAYTSATDGLKWASSGSTYSRPWKTPSLSICGGSSFIYTNYYANGQKTEYFTKFNTSASAAKTKYTHQYMSSLYGALNEAERMYKGYDATKLNGKYVFRIPVYESMPSTSSLLSLSKSLNAVSLDKTTTKATATSSIKLRSGPAATYSAVATIPSGAALTVAGGVATNNANRAYQISDPYWLKVTYGSHSGYVSAECIKAASSYNLANGKTATISYSKASASDSVYFLSSNKSVATVSTSGVVTAKKNGSCMIYAFCGGGFDVVGLTVSTSGGSTASSGKTKLTASNTSVTLSYTTHPYTGNALKPTVTVKCGSTKLKGNKAYTIAYSNNQEPGTATVKVTGTGNYTGTISKTFHITALTALYQTTAKVTYRSGCGTNYTAKGSLASGSVVNVVYGWYKTTNGVPWQKVLINGTYYYMCGKYLTQQVLVKYTVQSKVNYRTGCGTSYTVKGQFAKGKTVSIVKGWNKKVNGNTWYQVRVGSSYYYVMAKYLKRSETLLRYQTNARVNVRSAAGTSKTLKTILLKSTPVTVVKGGSKTVSGAAWYRVKIDASYYYMMASYLTKS